MDNLLSFTLIFAMVTGTIIFSLTSLQPIINDIVVQSKVNSMKSNLHELDNYISNIISGGYGASREFYLNNPDAMIISNRSKEFYYKINTKNQEEFYSKEGNVIISTGGDVNCYEDNGKFVAENNHIKFIFNEYGNAGNFVPIDTKNLIYEIYQKESGAVVNVDTPISILGSETTGTGYSELLSVGNNLPECTVKYHINGTYSYDIYFTLKSGDDFVITEIKFS